ncbi:hypothetical protein QQY66_44460 [Streptomyces sp. DG2A-72]|uniref:hypothetical protein n=1 Tax=Streptomyces sp. DG2A-72 TaxID=3051386 RepID=UPI00265B9321|nr:hypothetical protein [Streptomyces sp. DG2A-72]MDO0938440.1 hypothetical protein [Streptomyces sp. DG2A-72]
MSDDRRRADGDREPDDRHWLDEPRNVTRIVYGLAALCALALLADLFYSKHPYFSVERWPGFYAVFGFVASVTLVLTAKGLRRLLRRDEDYYEPPDPDRHEAPERGPDD